MSQLSKCLKFKSIQGDENDCILYKITPRNVTNFRHLLSCDTITKRLPEPVKFSGSDSNMTEEKQMFIWYVFDNFPLTKG